MFKNILKSRWPLLVLCLGGGCVLAAVMGRVRFNSVIMSLAQGEKLYTLESTEDKITVFCSDLDGKNAEAAVMDREYGETYRYARDISLTESGTCLVHYQEYEDVDDIRMMTAACSFEEGVMEDFRLSSEDQAAGENDIYKARRAADGCLWYVGTDGSVWRQEEEGRPECVFANDGSVITSFNSAYCLGWSGVYFYNREEGEIYAVPYDLGENAGLPVRTGLAEKWDLDRYGILCSLEEAADGTFAAAFWQEDSRVLPAVPGISQGPLPGVWMPFKRMGKRACVFSLCLLGAVAVLFLGYQGILLAFGNVFPISLTAFFLALPITAGGCVLLNRQIENVLTEHLWEQEKNRMYNGAAILARLTRQEGIVHGEPDVSRRFLSVLEEYYENSMGAGDVYSVSGTSLGTIAASESDYDLFLENQGEFYLVNHNLLTCVPSQAAYGAENASFMELCRREETTAVFILEEPGYGRTLTIFTPIADGDGKVTGLVRGRVSEEYVKNNIKEKKRDMLKWILIFLEGMAGGMTLYGIIGLHPLLRLRAWAEKPERGMFERKGSRGTGEVAQLIGFFLQMWETIALHLNKVSRLKEAYEPYIPQSIICIFGKDDIREIFPGLEQSMEAAILVIESEEMKREFMESDSEEFRIRSRIYRVVNERIEEEGGIIERFTRTGVEAVFKNGAEAAMKAAGRVIGSLSEGWEDGKDYFFGAGLMEGAIRFGIVGSNDRMDVMSDSPAAVMSEKLAAISCQYRTGILMTEKSLGDVKSEDMREDARRLSRIRLERDGEPEEIYECFADLGSEQRRLRRETKADFEQGLDCLFCRDYTRGRDCFARVLRRNKGDLAAERYFRICDRVMEGAKEDFPASLCLL